MVSWFGSSFNIVKRFMFKPVKPLLLPSCVSVVDKLKWIWEDKEKFAEERLFFFTKNSPPHTHTYKIYQHSPMITTKRRTTAFSWICFLIIWLWCSQDVALFRRLLIIPCCFAFPCFMWVLLPSSAPLCCFLSVFLFVICFAFSLHQSWRFVFFLCVMFCSEVKQSCIQITLPALFS